MRKEATKSGDECDWCSRWRRRGILRFKAGFGKFVKRAMNKRARRSWKAEL